MATLFKRGDSYYISFMYDGKRYKKSLKTDKKRIAEKKFALEIEKINNDEIGTPQKNKKLIDFIDDYDNLIKRFKSESLYIRYNQIIRWIKNFIEKNDILLVRHCTREHIENYLRQRREQGISPKTFNEELRLLKNLFKTAIEKGYCKNNPCSNISNMKYSPPPPRFFSKEEIYLILENATPRFKEMWEFLLNTGLRLGELANLEWSDIDEENDIIHIQVKDFWKPKNSQPRQIPMNKTVKEILVKRKEVNESARWVFVSKNGTQIQYPTRKTLVALLEKLGMKKATIHTFRHTFASNLVMAGVDLPTVQKLMGHSTIQMTMKYAHLAPEHIKSAVEKLEKSY